MKTPQKKEAQIRDLKRFKLHLGTIKQKGYAVSDAEQIPDVNAISMPVYDKSGMVVTSLTLAGPSCRFTLQKRKNVKDTISQYAQGLSYMLGYNKNSNPF